MADINIVAGNVDIFIVNSGLLSYFPPKPINPAYDQEYEFDSIDIYISVFSDDPNNIVYTNPIDLSIGLSGSTKLIYNYSISVSPISISLLLISYPSVEYNKISFVKWSKIGVVDFTIDESNVAGEMPIDGCGIVIHLAKLRDSIIAYCKNGVYSLHHSDIYWGYGNIYKVGIKNKGAFVGDDSIHFFVDQFDKLVSISDGISVLDYSEYLSSMGDTYMFMDSRKNNVYLCDGTTGYVYNVDSKSLGECEGNITGISTIFDKLLVTGSSKIETSNFDICTDIYDFGVRRPKTISHVELGTDKPDNLYVAIDYRNDYRGSFRSTLWYLVNPNGMAFPKCYGVEFRFRIKSKIYEQFSIDYIKVKGYIHGFSYLESIME